MSVPRSFITSSFFNLWNKSQQSNVTQWEVRDCEAPNTWRAFNSVQKLDSLRELNDKITLKQGHFSSKWSHNGFNQVRFGGCSDTLWFRPQQVCFSKIWIAQLHRCKEMRVRLVEILFSQRPLHLNREVAWILAHLRRRHSGQNRPRHNRRLLWADSRHTEVFRDWIHPFLPVPGPVIPVIVAFSPMWGQ